MSLRKFSELRAKMSPAARAKSEREFRRMVQEMPSRRLRNASAKMSQPASK